jgi:hypothetical protein
MKQRYWITVLVFSFTLNIIIQSTEAELWLTMSNGNVMVHAGAGFTNRVLLYAKENLMSNRWDIIATGLYPTENNPAHFPIGIHPVRFYIARSNYDSDGDGLPDWWELIYGLDPFNSSDAIGDADGDGISNWQEYQDGTNPNIANGTGADGAIGTLIFRFDDDGRLTETHLSGESVKIQELSRTHNATKIKVIKTNR